ncbi:MAG: hypothetical protein WCT35_04945 [Sideroxydans sp.]|jgi:hypothetical protein
MKTVYLQDGTQYNAQECPIEKGIYLIPEGATEIPPPVLADGETLALIGGAWVVTPATPPTPPTIEQRLAALQQDVQNHLDATAQARGYDNIISACSYAGAPNPFQAESVAFIAWRGDVWTKCYAQLAAFQSSPNSTIPTTAELIASLPLFVG